MTDKDTKAFTEWQKTRRISGYDAEDVWHSAIEYARESTPEPEFRKDDNNRYTIIGMTTELYDVAKVAIANMDTPIHNSEPWARCGECDEPLWKKSFADESFYYEPCHKCEPSSPKPVSVDILAGAEAMFLDNFPYRHWQKAARGIKRGFIEKAEACAKAWGLTKQEAGNV